MTLWRIYKHKCRFKHNVEDAPWLEDRACLIPHEHGFAPNPLCIIQVEVATKKVIDFKLVKKVTVEAVGALANTIIEKEVEDKIGALMQPWYYDFGSMTTEAMVDDLKKLILAEFKTLGHKTAKVKIRIEETRKYSVYDDGA